MREHGKPPAVAREAQPSLLHVGQSALSLAEVPHSAQLGRPRVAVRIAKGALRSEVVASPRGDLVQLGFAVGAARCEHVAADGEGNATHLAALAVLVLWVAQQSQQLARRRVKHLYSLVAAATREQAAARGEGERADGRVVPQPARRRWDRGRLGSATRTRTRTRWWVACGL